jgi:sugar phosphate isomerase/epimerase
VLALRTTRVKMSIGGFAPSSAASLAAVGRLLGAQPIELLIENDQTAAAGTLTAIETFLARAAHAGLSLPLTFDMGNWHWTGECPLAAARSLAPHVGYVHCKGVQRLPQRWVAVPLAQSAAPWRAVLRALPCGVPWAIEYPLAGDDLLAVTAGEVAQLRAIAAVQQELPA